MNSIFCLDPARNKISIIATFHIIRPNRGINLNDSEFDQDLKTADLNNTIKFDKGESMYDESKFQANERKFNKKNILRTTSVRAGHRV